MNTDLLICAAAGFVGAVGGISLQPKRTFRQFIFDSLLSMTFGVCASVIMRKYVTTDIEIVAISSIVVGVFSLDIAKEIREIIDSISDIFRDTIATRIPFLKKKQKTKTDDD